jgi:hypothetical protein
MVGCQAAFSGPSRQQAKLALSAHQIALRARNISIVHHPRIPPEHEI